MVSPLLAGSLVTWSPDAPACWHYIWTPGPMRIVCSRWDDGKASEYSQRFGGIPRKQGWIVLVVYDADSTSYYNPPLSVLLRKRHICMEIHERWLWFI